MVGGEKMLGIIGIIAFVYTCFKEDGLFIWRDIPFKKLSIIFCILYLVIVLNYYVFVSGFYPENHDYIKYIIFISIIFELCFCIFLWKMYLILQKKKHYNIFKNKYLSNNNNITLSGDFNKYTNKVIEVLASKEENFFSKNIDLNILNKDDINIDDYHPNNYDSIVPQVRLKLKNENTRDLSYNADYIFFKKYKSKQKEIFELKDFVENILLNECNKPSYLLEQDKKFKIIKSLFRTIFEDRLEEFLKENMNNLRKELSKARGEDKIYEDIKNNPEYPFINLYLENNIESNFRINNTITSNILNMIRKLNNIQEFETIDEYDDDIIDGFYLCYLINYKKFKNNIVGSKGWCFNEIIKLLTQKIKEAYPFNIQKEFPTKYHFYLNEILKYNNEIIKIKNIDFLIIQDYIFTSLKKIYSIDNFGDGVCLNYNDQYFLEIITELLKIDIKDIKEKKIQKLPYNCWDNIEFELPFHYSQKTIDSFELYFK